MQTQEITFNQLGLPDFLTNSIEKMGFTQPTPIQQQCIPHLIQGNDLLGVAQTGSGKTAAFALPLLTNINIQQRIPQILVMAPTRELAIQVAEACELFAQNMKGIKIVTLYGGQRYDIQLKALKQGAHIVVGTPGRLLDHIRRKTLNLSELKAIVLDEADEMLRMGFIDDVETIMAELPVKHQTVLFSATMPDRIKKITQKFMHKPIEVKIKANKQNNPDIEQVFCMTKLKYKSEILLRFLEVESYDAAIIFVRTKTLTLEIAELLTKHGFNAAALNGDMTQQLREQTLDRLRKGSLNILIATDVAARGLDVERISLVINYDITFDPESYIHRIGRTGRAGRAGKAILFVEYREKGKLRSIEHLVGKQIEQIHVPTYAELAESRSAKLKQQITYQLENPELAAYRSLLEDMFTAEQDQMDIAAAMLILVQGKQKLVLNGKDPLTTDTKDDYDRSNNRRDRKSRDSEGKGYGNRVNMNLYRIEVGREDGVEVKHIVGAIANEGNISSRFIGHIKLYDEYATVELPQDMPKDMLRNFSKTRVLNKPMRMSLLEGSSPNQNTKTNRSDKRTSRSDRREDKKRGTKR